MRVAALSPVAPLDRAGVVRLGLVSLLLLVAVVLVVVKPF